jgi:excisionase family DNA binding protein
MKDCSMPSKKNRIDPAVSSGTSPSDEDILTPEELAFKLKLKKATIYELTRKRGAGSRKPMPSLKAGKFLRFRLSDVVRWMEESAA